MSNNYSQDIPYTKQSDVQEYIDAFDIDNESIDFTTLENYSNSEYVLNANALQKVKHNIDVMQSNFNNDVISDLDDKQETFQSWIDNLSTTAKPWQSGSLNQYYKNDVVTYSEDEGAYYLCLQDCDGTQELPSLVSLPNINITYENLQSSQYQTTTFEAQMTYASTTYENIWQMGSPTEMWFGDNDNGYITLSYNGKYNIVICNSVSPKMPIELIESIDIKIITDNVIEMQELLRIINGLTVSNNYWLRLYLKGEAGLDAFKFDWRGEWNANSEYEREKSHEPGSIHPGSLVWYRILNNINFYFCIEDVRNSDIPPDQDTTHWMKLFTKKLDGFVILDSMPNQSWFNDDTNPSVFGVKQSDGFTIKIIDRIHSESASNPQYLKLYTVANNVVDIIFGSNDNNLNTLINNLISNTNI